MSSNEPIFRESAPSLQGVHEVLPALVVDLILELHDSTFLQQQNLTHGVTSRIDLQRPSENRIISLQSTDCFIFIRHAALIIFHSTEAVLVYLRLFSST